MNTKDNHRVLQAVARDQLPDDINLLPGILARVEKENRKRMKTTTRPIPGLRPVWAITLVILSVLVISTLIIGPQRVFAEFRRLFGYVPEVGIVNLDQVRVLENGVTQQHDGRELTAVRGLATERGTDLWLEFSDEARPIDDAWLETPDGQRFELRNWSYSPDEPGTRGVAANFPPLPSQVTQVTLALPEGWRIPLTWVPGSESAVAPANIVTAPLAASGEAQPVSDSTPASAPCAKVLDIEFCVQAAARAEGEMQVLIEAVSNGQYTSGSDFNLSMFDVPGETGQLALSDPNGHVYPVKADLIQGQGEPAERISTLIFPGTQELTGRLSLNIPAVLVSIPLSTEISIDLGEHPMPGQKLTVNQTIDVAGMPVHFGQAELVGDGITSTQIKLTSDPLDNSAILRPYGLNPGRPEGIQDRYGAGSGPDGLSISVELLQPTGLKTGILRIPLTGASIKVRGPFTLTFDAPAGKLAATQEPQIIADGTFEPLPTGEPLPMDAFQYTGRILKSGDLLTVAEGESQSILYAASPASVFTPEQVAVLPGQVLAVYPHPDRQGIDYITGEYDKESLNTIYRQLYTLRFGNPAPRLLVGQFERSAFNFAWSYDGRYLAYLANSDQPGQDYQRFVRLIDLSCRTTGACSTVTVDAGQKDLYQISWSPNDYRLSAGGTAQAQEVYGTSDIYLLHIDPESKITSVTNLTQSPAIEDLTPAQWTAGGDALLYACSDGRTAINEYSLCRNDLKGGVDEVLAPLLPWNMHTFHLTVNNWLVDRMPVMTNGVYSLRTYDLQTNQSSTLLEWQDNGKYWVETTVSPDGQWMATVIDDLGGLLGVNIETHESKLVVPAETNPHFVTWVK